MLDARARRRLVARGGKTRRLALVVVARIKDALFARRRLAPGVEERRRRFGFQLMPCERLYVRTRPWLFRPLRSGRVGVEPPTLKRLREIVRAHARRRAQQHQSESGHAALLAPEVVAAKL